MFFECSCLGRDCSCLLGPLLLLSCTKRTFLDASSTPSLSVCGGNNNNNHNNNKACVAADKRTAASQTTRVGTEKRIQVVLPNPASARSLAHQQSPEAPQWRIEVARPRSLADPGPSLRSLTPPVRLGHRGSRVNWVWQTYGKQPTAKPFHMHTLLPLSLVVMAWPLRREYMRTAPPPHTPLLHPTAWSFFPSTTSPSPSLLLLLECLVALLNTLTFHLLFNHLHFTLTLFSSSAVHALADTSTSSDLSRLLLDPLASSLLAPGCKYREQGWHTMRAPAIPPFVTAFSLPPHTRALCGLFTSMSHLAPCQYP